MHELLRNSLLASLLLGALASCSSSGDSPDPTKDTSGDMSDAPDASSDSPGDPSDSDSGTGEQVDGGTDPGEPGLAGVVQCAEDTCDLVGGDVCCITISGSSCTPDDECSGGFSAPQHCDGPEDCGDGQSCCAVFSFGGDIGSFCRSDCSTSEAGDEAELCHQTPDCSDASETCRSCQFQGAPMPQQACAGDDIPACS